LYLNKFLNIKKKCFADIFKNLVKYKSENNFVWIIKIII